MSPRTRRAAHNPLQRGTGRASADVTRFLGRAPGQVGDPEVRARVRIAEREGLFVAEIDLVSEETGPVGAPPTAQINHPGVEDRVGVPIPFIGEASDPEDGALAGASMVWTDSVEGEIGQGEAFDAALLTLGDHVVTLTATDADGNVGEDSIMFAIIEP